MSKLYFYKCAHFLLFLSLSTALVHQFHSSTKIFTLIPLIPTTNFPHSLSYSPHPHPNSWYSHPDSLYSHHSHPYSLHSHSDSLHSHHSHLDSPHSQTDSPHSPHLASLFSIPHFDRTGQNPTRRIPSWKILTNQTPPPLPGESPSPENSQLKTKTKNVLLVDNRSLL